MVYGIGHKISNDSLDSTKVSRDGAWAATNLQSHIRTSSQRLQGICDFFGNLVEVYVD
jgi:hypothetical protein